MQKKKVFISSVQSEFASERQMLFEYLITDALLCMFFEPFLFEKIPALAAALETVFLHEVEQCDIYLGLFGKNYGLKMPKVFRLPKRNLIALCDFTRQNLSILPIIRTKSAVPKKSP
jgi:hypothetical protein